MKFSVTQYYSKTVEIDAENAAEAYQKACETYSFDEVDEVPTDTHDVESIE